MDIKTHALDRVIEAISPSLAAELDRVLQQTRETMERQFETRLAAAVREAESVADSTARADLDRAVNAAKEETRRQVTAELEQEFGKKLSEAAEERAKLETAMAEMKSEWSTELTKVDDERELWRTIAETHRQLGEASTQTQMLDRFLNLAQAFAPGLAVYVTKSDGLALWKSAGKIAFPRIVSKEIIDPESYFRAITIRGKTVAAICAVPPFHAEPLDFVAGVLERSIENFGLRLRVPLAKAAAAARSA